MVIESLLADGAGGEVHRPAFQGGRAFRRGGLSRFRGKEHALAELAVGEASGDVADDFEFGRGQAVPAACWALRLSRVRRA